MKGIPVDFGKDRLTIAVHPVILVGVATLLKDTVVAELEDGQNSSGKVNPSVTSKTWGVVFQIESNEAKISYPNLIIGKRPDLHGFFFQLSAKMEKLESFGVRSNEA